LLVGQAFSSVRASSGDEVARNWACALGLSISSLVSADFSGSVPGAELGVLSAGVLASLSRDSGLRSAFSSSATGSGDKGAVFSITSGLSSCSHDELLLSLSEGGESGEGAHNLDSVHFIVFICLKVRN